MGTLRQADYYDKIYRTSETYNRHYTKSHYFRLWTRVLFILERLEIPAIVNSQSKISILELGCGPGQFAQMVKDRLEQHAQKFNYTGLDFSIEAVMKAREVCGMTTFYKADCLDPNTYSKWAGNPDLIIAMEILEHTDDLKILSLVPGGKKILITVPDFDDPAHVRHFKTIEEVRKRYSNFIEIETLEKFERWYILAGKVREAIRTSNE